MDAHEAKSHFARLLVEVEAGATFVITEQGRAVAHLVPADDRPSNPAEVIEELRAARVGVRLRRSSVRRMIDAGRR